MKRVLTSCLVVLICLTAFITGYCKGCYSYAEEISYMTNEELEAGINAYMEAKGGSMLGTVGARMAYAEGKLYNFLTSSDNATPIKTIEDLKSGLSWNRQAIEGMDSKEALMLSVTPTANSFLASYLVWLRQQHYFGDNVTENENGMFNTGIDNNIYDGELFVDDNGNYCFVTVVTTNFSTGAPTFGASALVKRGSPFIKQGGNDAVQFWEDNNNMPVGGNPTNYPVNYFSFTYKNESHTYKIYKRTTNEYVAANEDSVAKSYYQKTNSNTYTGYPVIIKGANNYLGYGMLASNNTGWVIGRLDTSRNPEITQVNINFYTNNNNNITVFPSIDADGTLYITPKVNVGVDGEVNYQPYIFNEGDTITNVVNNYYTDSGTKDKTITVPSDTPDGGGGGSSDNPSGGTPPDWSNHFPHLSPDGEGGFDFNFTLPDLNIDWNINGLTEKFPFSIPFDLIHFVQVLNAEPETPEFDWTIDLKIYQWHIDADLHQFDNLAGIVRNVEFIGFCITLVMITRRMIKG